MSNDSTITGRDGTVRGRARRDVPLPPLGYRCRVARKQRWAELSGRQKGTILGLVAVQAVLVAAAQRDLSSRGAGQVRGPRILWRILTTNTIGALAYFTAGRT